MNRRTVEAMRMLRSSLGGFGLCVAVAVPAFAQDEDVPLDLVGSWHVVAVGGTAIRADTTVTMNFEEAGTIGGSGGCNSIFGPLRFDSGGILIGPLATTRKACQPEIMTQEQDFLKAVGTVRDFRKEGSDQTLLLVNGQGDEVVRLTSGN